MPNRSQFSAAVVENKPICREHYRLTLRVPAFPSTEPGQFIQIACRDLTLDQTIDEQIDWEPGRQATIQGSELTGCSAFLRRPFSLAGRRDGSGGVDLEIIHRVVGVGTDWLAQLNIGQIVDILGPLGNRFELPSPDQTAILVGGGVGIPPMLYLAQKLVDHPTIAFCGATTRDLLALSIIGDADASGTTPQPCVAEFSRAIISTDDGSYGFRGFVTQALERYLDIHRSASTVVYTCGPEPMMKRVAEIAIARNISCQIAVERTMACGMGTCQSCCIRVKKPDATKPPLVGKDWCYRLACTDGPVFQGSELLW